MTAKTVLHNTLLLTGANVALRSVSLLFQVYLADVIGAVGMGKMQLVMTAGGFAMTLGTAGVRVAAMNLTARRCGKEDLSGMKRVILACMGWGLCFSCASALLLFLLSPAVRLKVPS